MSLREFADTKFGIQSEIFTAVLSEKDVAGAGWKGLLQEAHSKKEGQRLILCANKGDLYVSLSLYVDPEELTANRAHYDRLFGSVEFAR